MDRFLVSGIVCLFVAIATVQSLKVLDAEPIQDASEDSENDERLLIIPAITFNATGLLPTGLLLPALLGVLAVSALSIALTIGLGVVLLSFLFKYKYDNKYHHATGYSSGYGATGYGSNEGYTSYRSFFDPSQIDWENVSITDMLHLGTETWNKYEPTNKDCQKRLICEMHRDTKTLGIAAEKIVQMFYYLNYATALPLPDSLRELVDEYRLAANVGELRKHDCAEYFTDCQFSISKVLKDIKDTSYNRGQKEI